MTEPPVPPLRSLLAFAVAVATRAGQALTDAHARAVAVAYKDDGSPVTEADRASDARIRELLAERFPSHAVVSEEDEASADKVTRRGPLWVVDIGFVGNSIPRQSPAPAASG